MSMNSTPQGERIHIGFFGNTNTGKSSLINAMTGQEISIVSPVKGTTTDPVQKAMELLPLGPVLLIDTPGLNDETELGQQRIARTNAILQKTDIVVFVADAQSLPDEGEKALLALVEKRNLPVVIALNKAENLPQPPAAWQTLADEKNIPLRLVSAKTMLGIDDLKNHLAKMKPQEEARVLVQDLVGENETCVLVIPIDSSAPKGRLILPQQQVIRDLLEGGATALITRDNEYAEALNSLKQPPKLVITDSQVFATISKQTPADIALTSFSILFARYKGDLPTLVEGAKAIDALKDNDHVLICEGCTHHRQCDDIGTVKIPTWLKSYTRKELNFTFVSGTAFPSDLSPYKLIVHCGGCMLNKKEMQHRIASAKQPGIPIVNYGILISYLNGILDRCLQPLLS